jgi:hypothetical protein
MMMRESRLLTVVVANHFCKSKRGLAPAAVALLEAGVEDPIFEADVLGAGGEGHIRSLVWMPWLNVEVLTTLSRAG